MAFWIVLSGRSGKAIPRGLENGRIFVGPREKPVAILHRYEIEGYLTTRFKQYYGIWARYSSGFGLPFGDGWAQYPEHLVSVLEMFENEWRTATHGKQN